MRMQHLPDGKQLVTTLGYDVLCNPPNDSITAALRPCTQEEADTWTLLHTADAVRRGFQKIAFIFTNSNVDTDVLVLSVAAMHRLHLEHLWVAFGTGRYFKYIPAHEIAASIGRERAMQVYLCLCSTLERYRRSNQIKSNLMKLWPCWSTSQSYCITWTALMKCTSNTANTESLHKLDMDTSMESLPPTLPPCHIGMMH